MDNSVIDSAPVSGAFYFYKVDIKQQLSVGHKVVPKFQKVTKKGLSFLG
jgi:hypothetical protein